jgi:hypothetical protein
LLVRPSEADASRWDLVARLETGDDQHPRFGKIQVDLLLEAAPDRANTSTGPHHDEGTWFNFGQVPCLGEARDRRWEFWAGFWPVEGLEATHKETGECVRFSYETPFGAWAVRNAVHLPTDKVLFQLGDDQICAFDPATRRVALLWRGRGPVAVIPSSN